VLNRFVDAFVFGAVKFCVVSVVLFVMLLICRGLFCGCLGCVGVVVLVGIG
jgi:hypothetical protein